MIFVNEMTTKYKIVEQIATKRMVEEMVKNITHKSWDADCSDLSQMVYLILLEYDEDKIIDLWESQEMRFFIARIIINQFRSSHSPFHSLYRKFSEKSEDISTMDFLDED